MDVGDRSNHRSQLISRLSLDDPVALNSGRTIDEALEKEEKEVASRAYAIWRECHYDY